MSILANKMMEETMTETAVIVTDEGFSRDTDAPALELAPDADQAALQDALTAAAVRIPFASFGDGRGFTLARRLRAQGFSGRLRAAGHVLADQYAMARRSGFDEVEISAGLAARQPEDQWLARANWRAHDYQSRLRG